ncbi:GrpB family protein [Lentzea sp. BCCO 10_0798]|uniref:GrpB family protein n=1 Tax=Lentzea kristufekii TaxID=3095430 RepID=A0ABU4U5I4_9PSEU|nr:GrpB family protein [Lentzea sp. BCCO 10_0798]MDX8055261.1 GrpB family protein [Lentzea sp. BCCO 10_0798]
MSEKVPAWAFERAELRPYDPRWADHARAEGVRLTELLAPWLVDGIEHVGSTAVPELAAKPVIDLMASVSDLDTVVEQASASLAAHGWAYVPPELDNRPWRRFYVKPDQTGQRREAHLHLIQAGHQRWTDQIRFRDALRNDTTLAQAYEDLKRQLAAQSGHDREAYTKGKAEFVAKALQGPHA